MTQLHDTGYKFLFSHADLVRELMEVFAPPGVSELLDYSTLRHENGSFVTPAMKKREDDIVWSVELQGQRVYLYLLMEFQSSVDTAMPLRMLQYVAALYDHLHRSKTINAAEGLPPVLPIVLYNGDTRWTQSPEIFDMIHTLPEVLQEFQPRLRFWLLDEGKFSLEYLEGLQRLMAAIFRMEHTQSTEEAKQAIRYLGKMVQQSQFKQSIDQAVTKWMNYRLNHKMPGLDLNAQTLTKGTEMLETGFEKWRSKITAEALMQGLEKGKLEGKLEGKFEEAVNTLNRLLTKRFGSLPKEVMDQVGAASLEQVEAWFDRAIDAARLEDVFRGGALH